MTIAQIEKIINKIEGPGTFVYDEPIVFRRIKEVVNTFDWSTINIHYSRARVIFDSRGLYYIIPVIESKTEPTSGNVGIDYDIVDEKYWLYMKPEGNNAFDILSTEGIWAFNIIPKVTGGVV